MTKRIIKNIIYFSTFFPGVALAQVRPNPDSLSRPDIWQIFSSISGFLYVIFGGMGMLSIVGLFLAAVDYLAAGGDEERVGRSGKTLGLSLVGLVVATMGIVALNWASGAVNK